MASKSNAFKRARATNFSFNEKELFLKYAIENQNILENKESNAVSWKEKNICWLKIAEQYNSATSGCKLLRGSKSELFKTGGGPCKTEYSGTSELEKDLFEIIQLSVEGLPSFLDPDAIPQSAICPVNFEEHNVTHINPEKLADSSDSFIDYDIVLDSENNCLSVNNDIFLYHFLHKESVLDIPTMLSTQCANDSIIDNISIINHTNTSGLLSRNNKPSWSPIESNKLLRSTGKHQKLTTNTITRKNHSHASASDKFTLLAEKKIELVEIQKIVLLREHEENVIFLKAKHALELKSLELDIALKKKKVGYSERV
ncbi:hypothetical protein ACI65C_004854 [Semiaphis heraclei]